MGEIEPLGPISWTFVALRNLGKVPEINIGIIPRIKLGDTPGEILENIFRNSLEKYSDDPIREYPRNFFRKEKENSLKNCP